jgi:hypothetical protein
MKRLLPILTMAMLSLPVAAQGPSEFALTLPLVASSNDGLHTVELTEAVYRAAAGRHLADLRIFNANGEALPLARLPQPPAPPPATRTIELTLAPLPAQIDARESMLKSYALRIERDGERAVIEIGGTAAGAAQPAVGGYLIDARPLKKLRGRLHLVFGAGAPEYAGRVDVLGSDDLVNWRPIASGPLARTHRLGELIEKGSFELRQPPSFLRVAWLGEHGPELAAAQFDEYLPAARTLPRASLALVASDDRKSLLVEVPLALPIEQLVIRTPQLNQSLQVHVYRHLDERAPQARRLGLVSRRAPERWVPVGTVNVLRVLQNGVEVEGAPLPFTAQTDRLRIDSEVPFGEALPTVEAEWRPARYAFAARAPGPFLLAVGHADPDVGPVLDLRPLLSSEDPAALQWPTARIATAAEAAPLADAAARRAERIAAEARWSRWAMWGVLALALVALAWMAWRLAGQLRRPAGTRGGH